jgi:signal peptide peptidase SppA
MPYANEHSCRLREPDDFQNNSFRRVPRDHNGKRYDAIMGKLNGEDTMTDQAYRYPKDIWTVSEAKAHCKDHDGILFEPASGEEGAQLVFEGCCGEGQLAEISSPSDYLQKHSLLLQAFTDNPWAILPEKMAILEEIVMRHIRGEKLEAKEIQAAIHGAKRPDNRKDGKIAILPLFGVIFPRANLMTEISGATSAEIFGEQFDELVSDPEVSGIVLDVNSPGGNIEGIIEASRKIYEARGKKPIVAVANHMMASAAYWIGTAADEVVVTPSGAVGSIGVWSYHDDESGAMAKAGIKRTLISAGKYKVEGNPWEPLTEEARSSIQADVDEGYADFTRDVARNRGVEVGEVRNGYGEGRMVLARKAVKLGMADRMSTLEETVKRLQREIFRLSDEDRQKAEDLRNQINQILKKEKKA